MKAILWHILARTQGAKNRIRILRNLDEQSRNANQLAKAHNLDYKTSRHRLDII